MPIPTGSSQPSPAPPIMLQPAPAPPLSSPRHPCRSRHLHFDALIQRLRRGFETLPEQRRCPAFSLADTLMAGLAVFSLKDPSLLAFCGRALDHNLHSVFGLQAILSDTQLREILDEVA